MKFIFNKVLTQHEADNLTVKQEGVKRGIIRRLVKRRNFIKWHQSRTDEFITTAKPNRGNHARLVRYA